ncbi:MAG: hypothetical protein U1E45_06220 [Geminicoccaceae bacterium]
MSMRRSVPIAAAIACLLAGTASTARADTPDLTKLAGAAKFVAQTKVSKVDYGMSAAGGNGQGPVPYTIVTYQVVDPVRGSTGSASFSLRFIGGPDGRGHFLRASEVPVFQTGDEDILFVQDNGAKGCPLVSCIDGRFRVLNNNVHDGRGSPVQKVVDNKVVSSGAAPAAFGRISFPAPSFDELLKDPQVRAIIAQRGMTVDEARRRYAAEAPATIVMAERSGGASTGDRSGAGGGAATGNSGRAASGGSLSVAKFVAMIEAVGGGSRAVTTFQSVTAQDQIAAPTATAAAPPSGGASRSAGGPARSAADIAEEQSLPKDDPSIVRNKAQ